MLQYWNRETEGKQFWSQNRAVTETEDQEREKSQGIEVMQQMDGYSLKNTLEIKFG